LVFSFEKPFRYALPHDWINPVLMDVGPLEAAPHSADVSTFSLIDVMSNPFRCAVMLDETHLCWCIKAVEESQVSANQLEIGSVATIENLIHRKYKKNKPGQPPTKSI